MEKPYFSLEHVHYCYPDGTKALEDVSLTIPMNRKIAILGENGSGKSTLFQLLMGLLKPTAGNVSFCGMPLQYRKKDLKNLRQQVGLLFQDADNQLFAPTVKQDILFGPLNLGWDTSTIEKQVEQALTLTELTALANRPIHALSGGQKKRATIAGVYAMNPNIFILDEPTSSLDYYFSTQLMNYLTQLDDGRRSFLYATHQIDFIYGWADAYIVLHKGKVLYEGDAEGLFKDKELLAKAHIQTPWIVELTESLKKAGKIPSDTPLPQTKIELYRLLDL